MVSGIFLEFAKKAIGLLDHGRSREPGAAVRSVVGAFLEEHKHTRELLPEFSEAWVVRNNDELRVCVKGSHGLKESGDHHGAARVEGAHLVLNDRFQRGAA